MQIDPSLKWLLAGSIVAYLVVMYVIGFVAQRKVHSAEDFLVAGRRLPLSLAWMTLLATWFGAGTMLTAADEVRSGGLQRAALDPFGAGTCLLLAYVGESANELLEEAYLLTMVGLFVPLILGLYTTSRSGRAAIASMLVGTGIWALHFGLGWECFLEPLAPFKEMQRPVSLSATTLAFLAYILGEPPWGRGETRKRQPRSG